MDSNRWMDNLELKDLEPRVRQKALELMAEISREGEYDEKTLVSEAIRRAMEWFYEAEG